MTLAPILISFSRRLVSDHGSAVFGIARVRKYRKLDRAIADDGWQVVVLMRLSPIVPFNLQNYALGVTAIPFLQYLTATLIGIAPGIAIYVYFGIFGKGLGNGPSVFDWMLFGLGVLATIALAILVIRKTKPKFAEENPT